MCGSLGGCFKSQTGGCGSLDGCLSHRLVGVGLWVGV